MEILASPKQTQSSICGGEQKINHTSVELVDRFQAVAAPSVSSKIQANKSVKSLKRTHDQTSPVEVRSDEKSRKRTRCMANNYPKLSVSSVVFNSSTTVDNIEMDPCPPLKKIKDDYSNDKSNTSVSPCTSSADEEKAKKCECDTTKQQNLKCHKPGPLTRNPFLNFLREFRKRCCGLTAVQVSINGAKEWNCMTCQQKSRYKPNDGCCNKSKRRRKIKRRKRYKGRSGCRKRKRSRCRRRCKKRARNRCRKRKRSKCRPKPKKKCERVKKPLIDKSESSSSTSSNAKTCNNTKKPMSNSIFAVLTNAIFNRNKKKATDPNMESPILNKCAKKKKPICRKPKCQYKQWRSSSSEQPKFVPYGQRMTVLANAPIYDFSPIRRHGPKIICYKNQNFVGSQGSVCYSFKKFLGKMQNYDMEMGYTKPTSDENSESSETTSTSATNYQSTTVSHQSVADGPSCLGFTNKHTKGISDKAISNACTASKSSKKTVQNISMEENLRPGSLSNIYSNFRRLMTNMPETEVPTAAISKYDDGSDVEMTELAEISQQQKTDCTLKIPSTARLFTYNFECIDPPINKYTRLQAQLEKRHDTPYPSNLSTDASSNGKIYQQCYASNEYIRRSCSKTNNDPIAMQCIELKPIVSFSGCANMQLRQTDAFSHEVLNKRSRTQSSDDNKYLRNYAQNMTSSSFSSQLNSSISSVSMIHRNARHRMAPDEYASKRNRKRIYRKRTSRRAFNSTATTSDNYESTW